MKCSENLATDSISYYLLLNQIITSVLVYNQYLKETSYYPILQAIANHVDPKTEGTAANAFAFNLVKPEEVLKVISLIIAKKLNEKCFGPIIRILYITCGTDIYGYVARNKDLISNYCKINAEEMIPCVCRMLLSQNREMSQLAAAILGGVSSAETVANNLIPYASSIRAHYLFDTDTNFQIIYTSILNSLSFDTNIKQVSSSYYNQFAQITFESKAFAKVNKQETYKFLKPYTEQKPPNTDNDYAGLASKLDEITKISIVNPPPQSVEIRKRSVIRVEKKKEEEPVLKELNGFFQKKSGGHNKWQKRFFELHPANKSMLWKKNEKDTGVTGVIFLNPSVSIARDNLILTIRVNGSEKAHQILFDNLDDLNTWETTLRQYIGLVHA